LNSVQHNAGTTARREGEAGTVLVLFALLFVGLFGMLGAVVDGGRLRVTRQQMDAGAECGALEGVRFKDTEGDAARRARAISAASYIFDDDLNPANGDVMGLGAGTLPVVFDDAPLSGTIDVALEPAQRAWKPADQLEQNPSNQRHGDLVAGIHNAAVAPAEDDAFRRDDFLAAPSNSGANALSAQPAFLVRIRRASERLALDRQAGESSSGPPFEWLWARGGAWHEPVNGETNASRSDGLTLRATAIASTERALLATGDPAIGVTLAAFTLRSDAGSAWQATAPGSTLALDVDPSGALLLGGVEEGIAIAAPAQLVGDVPSPSTTALASAAAGTIIVPVYADVASVRRIIGFTLAQATLSGSALAVTRQASAVLPNGATATSPAAHSARIALDAEVALSVLHSSFTAPLLAPVLRR